MAQGTLWRRPTSVETDRAIVASSGLGSSSESLAESERDSLELRGERIAHVSRAHPSHVTAHTACIDIRVDPR